MSAQQLRQLRDIRRDPPRLRFDSNQSPDWPTVFERAAAFLTTDLTVMADDKLQYVISNERPIGFLLSCASGWKSYDVDGQPLGIFHNENDAAKAVYQPADAARTANPGG